MCHINQERPYHLTRGKAPIGGMEQRLVTRSLASMVIGELMVVDIYRQIIVMLDSEDRASTILKLKEDNS